MAQENHRPPDFKLNAEKRDHEAMANLPPPV
jgi:hypothetical protein